MPTSKRRINITIGDDEYAALERLAKRDQRSVSSVGLSLIERGLELEEDRYFSRIADSRLEKRERRIPHDKAWD